MNTSHATSAGGAASGISLGQLPIFQLGFWRFLMVITGLVAGVFGTWNLPRQESLDGLHQQLEALEQQRAELVRGAEEDRRWYDGIAEDPRVEAFLLEGTFGAEPDRGIPLRLWLTGARPEPTP